MATELQTRIQLKHDTEANWNVNGTFAALDGEMIIYDADDNVNFPRFKIGNGSTPIKELPFATAKEIEAAINNALTTGGAIYNAINEAKTDVFNQVEQNITIDSLGGIKGTYGNQTIEDKGTLPEGEFYFYYKD